jgi:crotonobetainyl-CoA:carnitine CoA-transferase CaiB-like acyl-CoA transferase
MNHESNMDLPLNGVRVLDLTHRLAGPTMTMMLGDWGASILKVEWWNRMDAWRGVISIEHDENGQEIYNKKPNWLKLNRNKRSLTLNLKTDRGKEIFLELARHVEVVADNFSANVLTRLGLGYSVLSEINPSIIMISMPGLGNTGPHSHFVSNGATVEGYAGLASLTGYKGGDPRNSVGIWPDPVAGVHGAIAVAMALINRRQTGRGQHIELAQSEATMNMVGDAILEYAVNGNVKKPVGNTSDQHSPNGVYRCKGHDKWISIVVRSQEEWSALCSVARESLQSADPRFASIARRLENSEALDDLIELWTTQQEPWNLAERLQAVEVEAAPVATFEDFESRPGLPTKDFLVNFDYEFLKKYPGPSARFDGRTPPIRLGPPRLGEHTAEILSELLHFTDQEVESLRAQGVV